VSDVRREPAPMGRILVAPLLGCVVVFLISAWPTLTSPLLYSNDGPQHLLQGFVHGHYEDPRFGFNELLALNEPLTSRGYLDLFRWLEPRLGWYDAHRAILLIAQLLWCSAWAALVLRLHPDRWPFALLGCATAIQWAYWLGFVPYFLGLGLTAWSLHLVLVRPQRRHYGLLAVALLLGCQVHAFAVAVTGIALLILALFRGLRAVAATVLAGLPALLFNISLSAASMHQQQRLAWDAAFDPVVGVVGRFVGGDQRTTLLFAGLAVAAVVVGRWARRDRTSRALLVGGLLLLVTGYVAPDELRGWQLTAPRYLPLGFALVFASCPLEHVAARFRRALGVVVFAFVALHAEWTDFFHRHLGGATDPVVALARRLPPQTGRLWGFLVTTDDLAGTDGTARTRVWPSNLDPWLHLAQVVAVDLGGQLLFTQAIDAAMHAILSAPVFHNHEAEPGWSWAGTWPAVDVEQRRRNIAAKLDGLRRSAPHLVFARVTDGVRTAVTATFRGCETTIVVPPDVAVVETGAAGTVEADMLRAPDVDGVVVFERAGCGERWIRVHGAPCGGSSRHPLQQARALFRDGGVLVCPPDR